MASGDQLLEAVTADTIVSESARARRYSLPVGSPCANCATPLAGPWCHACGQRGEDFHRSILKLVWEAIEGLTNLDSRAWRTVPRLIVRPGKLTREYLEGHRAAQIPPFRIFLVVLLLVFFAGGLALQRSGQRFNLGDPGDANLTKTLSRKDRAEFEKGMAAVRTELSSAPTTAAAQSAAARTALADAAAAAKAATADAAAASPSTAAKAVAPDRPTAEPDLDAHLGKDKNSPGALWLKGKLQRAIKNPDSFFLSVQEWAQRGAVLMLPIAALMLSVLFAFKKGVYVFDHLIFAMHSLSFVGLLLSAIFLASIWLGGVWWLLWLAPVHLFVHMRGTYGTGVLGTLWRMWWLFLGTSIVVAVLAVGLIFLGLATVR